MKDLPLASFIAQGAAEETYAYYSSIQMTSDRYGHLFPSGDVGAELAAAEKAFLS